MPASLLHEEQRKTQRVVYRLAGARLDFCKQIYLSYVLGPGSSCGTAGKDKQAATRLRAGAKGYPVLTGGSLLEIAAKYSLIRRDKNS
jgi:hypothetical protein